MPKTKYQKPKNMVAFYYDEKELLPIISKALKHLFPSGKTFTSTKTAEKFYNGLCAELGATKVLLITEQFPLNSQTAHGKFGDIIFQVVGKTGTQYTRKHVTPKNPRTSNQTLQRNKMKAANLTWKSLAESEKKQYNKRAEKLQMSGFNLFISEYLRKI